MRHIETLRAALQGVIKVADRDTAEFNAARAALAATAEPEQDEPDFWWNGLKENGVISETETTNADIPLFAGHNPQSNMSHEIADLTAQLADMTKERDALAALVNEARRAIGNHYPPNDCYATGPLTGNDLRDLVECPACSFITMHTAIAATKEPT